jgi:hypothetical protein
MVDIAAQEPDPMTVVGDETGEYCRAYGGCEFKARCPEANKPQTLVQLFGKRPAGALGGLDMGAMEDLKARLASRMGAATEPQPAAQAAPPVASVAAAPAAVAPAQPADVTQPVQITPPDAPTRTNEPGDVEAAQAPKRRGRPPGTKNAAPAPVVAPVVASAARGGRVLYVGVKPLRGPHAGADQLAWAAWMSGLLAELHGKLNVLDYRLVEFGKGRGALSAAIREALPTAPDVCFVDPTHPEASDFLAVALPQADEVTAR